MADRPILELLLQGEITPSEVSEWVTTGKTNSTVLGCFEKERPHVVLKCLNYIHGQSGELIQNSQVKQAVKQNHLLESAVAQKDEFYGEHHNPKSSTPRGRNNSQQRISPRMLPSFQNDRGRRHPHQQRRSNEFNDFKQISPKVQTQTFNINDLDNFPPIQSGSNIHGIEINTVQTPISNPKQGQKRITPVTVERKGTSPDSSIWLPREQDGPGVSPTGSDNQIQHKRSPRNQPIQRITPVKIEKKDKIATKWLPPELELQDTKSIHTSPKSVFGPSQAEEISRETLFTPDKISRLPIKALEASQQSPETGEFRKKHELSPMSPEENKVLCLNITEGVNSVTLNESEKQNHPAAYLEPDLSLVTDKIILDRLVSIMSTFLNELLVPSVPSELGFIVQLLSLQVPSSCKTKENNKKYFGTIHNCVYFATSVLSLQRNLIDVLDKVTIKLLLDNERIKAFDGDFSDFLLRSYESKLQHSNSSNKEAVHIRDVAFQEETDNRYTFSNENAFHFFRKQRDIFCNMLKTWEMKGGSVPGTSTKVRSLVDSCTSDPCLSIHLARLFVAHLVNACKADRLGKTDYEEAEFELLSELKDTDPEKFKRLQERFLKPQLSNEQVMSSTFPGAQEFFRDFIVFSNNSVFDRHLCDVMVTKLLELDDLQLSVPDQCSNLSVSKGNKDQFISALVTCRVLGKFSGFLYFRPYASKEANPIGIELRNTSALPIDINTRTTRAWRCNRLILTIPWVAKFFATMDQDAAQIPQIRTILQNLVRIYKEQRNGDTNSRFIQFVLGDLFKLPNFPTTLLYLEDQSTSEKDVEFESPPPPLDIMNLVESDDFSLFCPEIQRIKMLLAERSMRLGSHSGPVRKIAPVTTRLEVSSENDETKLQAQLEENFFHYHCHSQTVRNVVHLITERVASNAIKHLRTTLYEEMKAIAVKNIQISGEQVKNVAPKLTDEVKVRSLQFAGTFASEHCRVAIHSLLAEENKRVLSMLVDISCRNVCVTVKKWVTEMFTVELFEQDLTALLNRKEKNKSDETTIGSGDENIPDKSVTCFAVSGMISKVKDSVRLIYMFPNTIPVEQIYCVIEECASVLSWNCQLSQNESEILLNSLVDILLGIVVNSPNLLTEELVDSFCGQIKLLLNRNNQNKITSLVSSRNVTLLIRSYSPRESVAKFVTLLEKLISENVVSAKSCLEDLNKVVDKNELKRNHPDIVADIYDTLTRLNV